MNVFLEHLTREEKKNTFPGFNSRSSPPAPPPPHLHHTRDIHRFGSQHTNVNALEDTNQNVWTRGQLSPTRAFSPPEHDGGRYRAVNAPRVAMTLTMREASLKKRKLCYYFIYNPFLLLPFPANNINASPTRTISVRWVVLSDVSASCGQTTMNLYT